ncbi:MAG TPA: hypothetical protein VNP89_09905 [Gaiellaceae bacterium]|nr:hypothetical protein [Gaiellaceae bacterium]
MRKLQSQGSARHALRLRAARHLADAIEALAALSRSLSDDRSPKNPYS